MGLTADDLVGIAEKNKVGRKAIGFSHHLAYCNLDETTVLLASGGRLLKGNSLTAEGLYAIEVGYKGYTFRHISDNPISVHVSAQRPRFEAVCI